MFQLATTWHRSTRILRAWLLTLSEWPLLVLLGLFALGVFGLSQQPLHYTINIGYEEGWHSDQPLIAAWNTAEPEHATADQLSYRWTSDRSAIRLPGLGRQSVVVELHQLPATANPAVGTGALHLSAGKIAVSQPLTNGRTLHLLLPPDAAQAGALQLSAPAFTPPNDPRTLGAPIGMAELSPLRQALRLPPLALFWPLLLLPLAWAVARRWCLTRTNATIAGIGLIGLLLAALYGDRLRFALAGGPLLTGAIWGLIVGAAALWLIERYAVRLGVQPSPGFARSVALLIFWLMLLRYGGRLYPDSMVGDLGFHVNRQNDLIRGLVLLISRHRGIDFPYPSATYILLAPLRLLPIAPETLVEWSDALFGTLGLLPVAYLALRGLRDERAALLATTVYALLAPAMMALWWSFLAHIFTQEVVALLIALLVGMWHRMGTARGVSLITVALSIVFFGHFGLFINISILLAGLLPLLWWRYRATPQVRQVYGLAIAFVIAEALALGLFYSAYVDLIVTKLGQFQSGGMGAVQGGRSEISRRALALALWRDGFVGHYAAIGVPLALLGGYWLWRQQRGQILVWLFWGTVAVAVLQGTIPFITASTITTRWLSFCAWVIAVGAAVVLDWLWRRGRLGQGVVVLALLWIGGSTLWLWVRALGYRIRPPEPF
ncbi:MAG TPA: hypothetical protein VFZ66_11590 [Herpetosiphonaceae bacterium]